MDTAGNYILSKQRQEVSDTSQHLGIPREEATAVKTSESVVGEAWYARLFYVHDAKVGTLLGRVLADELMGTAALTDPCMADIQKGLKDSSGEIGALNMAVVARCLFHLPEHDGLLPVMPGANVSLGQPARADGYVVSVETKDHTSVVRLECRSPEEPRRISVHVESGHRLRLVESELRNEHLVILGFVRSTKYQHIDVAAAMLIVPRSSQ